MEDTTDQFVVFPVTLRRVRNAILFRGVFDCVKSFAQLSLKSNFKSDRLYTVASSWPSAAPRDDIVNESKELWLSSCGNSHSRISYTGITELLLISQTWISQTHLMHIPSAINKNGCFTWTHINRKALFFNNNIHTYVFHSVCQKHISYF